MSDPTTIYTREGGIEDVTPDMVNGAIDRALAHLLKLSRGRNDRIVRLAELELSQLRQAAAQGDRHE